MYVGKSGILPLVVAAATMLAISSQSSEARDKYVTIDQVAIEKCIETKSQANANADIPMQCVGKGAEGCAEETGFSRMGIHMCQIAEYKYWDQRVDEAYHKLVAKMQVSDSKLEDQGHASVKVAPIVESLLESWRTYRNHHCDFEASRFNGESGQGSAVSGCLMRETARKFFLLQERLG